jgi:hypothetical protein
MIARYASILPSVGRLRKPIGCTNPWKITPSVNSVCKLQKPIGVFGSARCALLSTNSGLNINIEENIDKEFFDKHPEFYTYVELYKRNKRVELDKEYSLVDIRKLTKIGIPLDDIYILKKVPSSRLFSFIIVPQIYFMFSEPIIRLQQMYITPFAFEYSISPYFTDNAIAFLIFAGYFFQGCLLGASSLFIGFELDNIFFGRQKYISIFENEIKRLLFFGNETKRTG